MQNLSFHNGKFKIMQITDIQDTPGIDRETMALIEAALDQEKPDLVVLTGDQVKGQSPSMRGEKNAPRVREAIREICAPLDARGIPFTLAFGNHDVEKISGQRQLEWYRESPNCLAADTPGLSGCGNHNLVIEDAEGKPALNVYMLDSHGAAGLTGYQPIQPDQVDWYRKTRDALKEQAGDYVPSLLFMHIPVEQLYRLMHESDKKTKASLPGFAGFAGKHYTLDETKATGRHREQLCVPREDGGLFDAAREKGDMLGMFFGHDHKNSFHGKVDGIDLGYCPGCGFAAYGDGVYRGVRVFEFDEANPRDYSTRVIHHKDLFGRRRVRRLSHWLIDQTPTSVDDGIRKGVKVLVGLGVIVAAIVALVLLLGRGGEEPYYDDHVQFMGYLPPVTQSFWPDEPAAENRFAEIHLHEDGIARISMFIDELDVLYVITTNYELADGQLRLTRRYTPHLFSNNELADETGLLASFDIEDDGALVLTWTLEPLHAGPGARYQPIDRQSPVHTSYVPDDGLAPDRFMSVNLHEDGTASGLHVPLSSYFGLPTRYRIEQTDDGDMLVIYNEVQTIARFAMEDDALVLLSVNAHMHTGAGVRYVLAAEEQ